MKTPQQFLSLIRRGVSNRQQLLEKLHDEHTNCYRLFHGSVEGWPSVTIDRYGRALVVQTWRAELNDGIVLQITELIEQLLQEELLPVWIDRSTRGQAIRHLLGSPPPTPFVGTELGLRYNVHPVHQGIDPLLFLDFRAGRRWIKKRCKNRSVLNLFSYTCGIGVCAMSGGASNVLNVDFSSRALSVGQENASANQLSEGFKCLQQDAIAVLRQFSGLGIKGRARKRSFQRLRPQQFDVVVLDPPRRARSPFGTVDTVNDYQSLFKPALLCVNPSGNMLITNNVASVQGGHWKELVQRCASKAGRPINQWTWILPETDFPSPDGQSPLKMAWLSV